MIGKDAKIGMTDENANVGTLGKNTKLVWQVRVPK